MKRENRLLAALLSAAFMLTSTVLGACAPAVDKVAADAAEKGGGNSYYEEMNLITYGGLTFRLGDTLSDLKKRGGQLVIEEEKALPGKDSEDAISVMGNGRRVLDYMDSSLVKIKTDSGEDIPLIWATVENSGSKESSSYEIPITQYDMEDTVSYSLSIPAAVTEMIGEHKDEEEWSQYDGDKLCFSRIQSETIREGSLYDITARVVVFEDQKFDHYLQFLVKGLYGIRSDEDIEELKAQLGDQLSDEQKARIEQKEQFVMESISLKGVKLGTPQEDQTVSYGEAVCTFLESGRNQDYFLKKGDITYTILEPYGEFLKKQELVPDVDQNYVFQPEMERLGAYGNGSTADTARYALTKAAEDSDDVLILPVITNFTGQDKATALCRVTQVVQYGGYDSVALPADVEDALNQYWMQGDIEPARYEYEKEWITVQFVTVSGDGGYYQCYADVTPREAPELTIRYDAMAAFDDGRVTDADFSLLDEVPAEDTAD